jgi:hypothetical protein
MPSDMKLAQLFDQANALWRGLEEELLGYVTEQVSERFGEPIMAVYLIRIQQMPCDVDQFQAIFLVQFRFRDAMTAEVVIQEQEVLEAVDVT